METEWRLVAVRSLGIASVLACLSWMPLSQGMRSAALIVLASALIYNVAIQITGVVAAGFVGCDLLDTLVRGGALDGVLLLRSGLLFLTAFLASYLRSQARRA